MNDVRALSPLVQKRTEGVQVYTFQCYQDYQAVVPDSKYDYQASLSTEESLIKTVTMQVEDGQLSFQSDQILDVPAGVYRLEIWELIDGVIHAIYPSNRFLRFTVAANTRDLPQGTVSSLTLDEFEKRFKEYASKTVSGDTKFVVGETKTADPDQPATVEMVTSLDGTITVNYVIPRGHDGKDGTTWKPYIGDDGYWHIREQDNPKDNN